MTSDGSTYNFQRFHQPGIQGASTLTSGACSGVGALCNTHRSQEDAYKYFPASRARYLLFNDLQRLVWCLDVLLIDDECLVAMVCHGARVQRDDCLKLAVVFKSACSAIQLCVDLLITVGALGRCCASFAQQLQTVKKLCLRKPRAVALISPEYGPSPSALMSPVLLLTGARISMYRPRYYTRQTLIAFSMPNEHASHHLHADTHVHDFTDILSQFHPQSVGM